MIDKMAESIFESMLPLTIEQLSSSPFLNYPPNEEDDRASNSHDCHILTDDHWKKFELDFPELSDIDDIFKEIDCGSRPNGWLLSLDDVKDGLFLNHDCMWAGHCGSKEHAEEPRSGLGCIVPLPPVIKKEMCPPSPVINKAADGQQSLLKPSVKAAIGAPTTFTPSTNNTMNQRSPLTPPESDDEENKAHTTSLLKILNDAINECELDEDSDLTEYFEGKEVEVKEEPIEIKEEPLEIKEEPEDTSEDTDNEQDEIREQQYRIRTQMAAENDHSYYKDKNAVMRHSDYGLDTPSDSGKCHNVVFKNRLDIINNSKKCNKTDPEIE